MSKQRNEWLRLSTIGTHFLAATLIGYWIGGRIDRWFETDPLWTVLLALGGIAAGFVNLFRELRILERNERERSHRDSEEDSQTNQPDTKVEHHGGKD